MLQRLKKLIINFLFFLELQLLISIVMLPVLIAWGLPISTMSIAGNLIFAQFLTVFIFISALLFTTDILGIPNNLIAIALDYTTSIWHYFLSFGSAHWLIGFSQFMIIPTSLFAIIACSLYYFKKHSQNSRIALLSFLYLCTPIIHTIFQSKSMGFSITQGRQTMYVFKKNGAIYAFDCGALGARPSSKSWIEYTLSSAMVKNMGATHIDLLVLCKSNSRTEQAAQTLMEHIPTSKCINLNKSNY